MERICLHPLLVDIPSRRIHVNEVEVKLTTMESELLAMLSRNAGTVVQREHLYTRVLGTEYNGIDRGLDVHVSRIRRKLQLAGFDPARIKSVRAVGYLMACR